jgi:hypothetical protein
MVHKKKKDPPVIYDCLYQAGDEVFFEPNCDKNENSHRCPGQRYLKVVTNEKLGGSGSWLVFEDGFGPWRSMSVYFLMLPWSFLQSISVSCL